ncbi:MULTISPECIES: 30S ribosome-binding factor RbfA [unclassified Kosmotoga]|jgi:ribosome-binding factor A|uniref:30S ribosome-binding factor RbfA n=1 Tax=unclassified Kosmotoga TaxID=2631489 RepID=UPI0007C5DB3F|nr:MULTISPECIES: 30S ribosome-binding factor RbfA [unclassified Kosmotoga]MDI3523950.1 ribosome-binding factor [Kosmotoga sp.]OAA19225.1 ribosome-binding factor A [Kosmotoga sp. DU53]
MSAGYRKAMLESEIQKVLTEALRNFKGESEIDPTLVSIVRIELSKDKRCANIFVSYLGNDEEKKKAVEFMEENKGYFRTAVAKNIRLFKAPELRFHEDIGIEASLRISKILEEIKKQEQEKEENE